MCNISAYWFLEEAFGLIKSYAIKVFLSVKCIENSWVSVSGSCDKQRRMVEKVFFCCKAAYLNIRSMCIETSG